MVIDHAYGKTGARSFNLRAFFYGEKYMPTYDSNITIVPKGTRPTTTTTPKPYNSNIYTEDAQKILMEDGTEILMEAYGS